MLAVFLEDVLDVFFFFFGLGAGGCVARLFANLLLLLTAGEGGGVGSGDGAGDIPSSSMENLLHKLLGLLRP